MPFARGLGALLIAVSVLAAPPASAKARRPPPTPSGFGRVFTGGPIAPNGTLIFDAERLRTLELDDLAPARIRISIPF